MSRLNLHWRWQEALMLIVIYIIAAVAYVTVGASLAMRTGGDPEAAIRPALVPVAVIAAAFTAVHITLSVKRIVLEQTILPVVALLFVIGSVMIYRLRGTDGFQQQVLRGLVPGVLVMMALLIWPELIERIRRWVPLPAAFSVENGLLTPTMKVKRRAVLERFDGEIAGLYR